jgi:hypothetical protein
MFKRQLAASPGTFGFMIQGSIFLGKIDYCIIAFVDVQLKPAAVNAFLRHAYTRRQAPSMVAAGRIARDQSRH